MKALFVSLVVRPFYNALILLMDFVTSDIGIALVILTLVFRFILFPLYRSQIRTQIKMGQVQEPLKKIQEKYKDDRETMGREMLKLYRQNKINPFSGILIMIIQLPLLIGFYYVFSRSGLPNINENLLYSFVSWPENINTMFLGLIDMTGKSLPLAIIVGITHFFQMRLMLPKKKEAQEGDKPGGSKENMMRSMQTQMSYFMPGMMAVMAYTLGSMVGLYFFVGGLISIGQEFYIRENIRKPEEERLKKEKNGN
ncbi:MAG TPA: YidC/Oxa1 family membrane protein insertase [Candidatus Paceibacterota bacterium]|nr:YidC/Oxa1 family membrane protein insertase [Candidatus Paceibacterota bacterium]HRZ34233.1 YidC/Oxa1 family membrane protein insertase [Candidatus Paceibacterota bacterium]